MLTIIASILMLVIAARRQWLKAAFRAVPAIAHYPQMARYALAVIGVTGIASTSFVYIGADEVGHLDRIYALKDLPEGRIIAREGEKGKQSRILGPGFHFSPFIRVLYNVETFEPVVIPEGHYGFMVAKDGSRLRPFQYLADPWPEEAVDQMLNADYFLPKADSQGEALGPGEGRGQRGPQLTVLKPGVYRLNRYLFDVTAEPALDVPTGHVAVIRSNVQTATDEQCPNVSSSLESDTDGDLVANIVSKGCIGVWSESLVPGRYYLNSKAYVSTLVPTRALVWTYAGGYKARQIDLKVGQDGGIEQTEESREVPVPRDAADSAINVRVEGWVIPVEGRIVVSVSPKNAARVVASVGNLDAVENRIITPAFKELLLTIGGQEGARAMDFMEKRDEIVSKLETVLKREGQKAGLTISEVRLGVPALPPEALIARARQQLANQLEQTYQAEQDAQEKRIAVERARALANQQSKLVEAEIERQKLLEVAQGQKAQAEVLGADRTMGLKLAEMILDAAKENPDLVKVSAVSVQNGDSASSLEGAAAVLSSSGLLGNSNIATTLRQAVSTPTTK